MFGNRILSRDRSIIVSSLIGEAILLNNAGNWICPPGVTSVSGVLIGGGGYSNSDYPGPNGYGGGGGSLIYFNNVAVIPGTSYPYTVGNSNTSILGFTARMGSGGTTSSGGAGGTPVTPIPAGGVGFSGGNGGGSSSYAGGGGAASYTGNGATAGDYGMGLYGIGSTGNYGKGGQADIANDALYGGQYGAIRLIWGGGRSFPSNAPATQYATWNPSDKGAGVNLSNNDRTVSVVATPNNGGCVRSTIGKSSGKWYFEFYASSTNPNVAVMTSTASVAAGTYPGQAAGSWSYHNSGQKGNGGSFTSYGASYTSGDTIGVKLDMDNGTIEFLKNNVSQGIAFTGITGTIHAAVGSIGANGTLGTANFGASTFMYAVPSGYNPGLT